MQDDFSVIPPVGERPETPSERTDRIRLEAAMVARGREDFAAGRVFDGDALDAWFELLEHDVNAPLPKFEQEHTEPPHR